MKDKMHVPIGTGDHVIDLMLNRAKEKPQVSLKCLPETGSILVTMMDDMMVVATHRTIFPEEFKHFGHVLDEMEKELLDRKEQLGPVTSQIGYFVDEHGTKTRVFG